MSTAALGSLAHTAPALHLQALKCNHRCITDLTTVPMSTAGSVLPTGLSGGALVPSGENYTLVALSGPSGHGSRQSYGSHESQDGRLLWPACCLDHCDQSLWTGGSFFSFVSFFLSFFFCFLGPHLQHMEVPRLGAESELWLPPQPQPQQHQVQAACVTYTTPHGNTRSLTHWVRPEIEPTSSWILVRFVTTGPQWKLGHGILVHDRRNRLQEKAGSLILIIYLALNPNMQNSEQANPQYGEKQDGVVSWKKNNIKSLNCSAGNSPAHDASYSLV